MPEFEAEWTFSETFEADDKDAARALMRERIDKFTEPDRFRGVKRSIWCRVEAIPPGEVGRQDLL